MFLSPKVLLHEALFGSKPGQAVEMSVWRDGRAVSLRPVLRGDR